MSNYDEFCSMVSKYLEKASGSFHETTNYNLKAVVSFRCILLNKDLLLVNRNRALVHDEHIFSFRLCKDRLAKFSLERHYLINCN